jgi:very-short-patch-repair endonuclease
MPRPSSYPETLFTCADCQTKSILLKNGHAKKFIERGQWLCRSCVSRRTAANLSPAVKQKKIDALKKANESRTPEQHAEIGRKRRARVRMSGKEMRAKQQETINSDPVRYAAYCEKRRKISKAFHAGMTDEDKAAYYAKVLKTKGVSRAEDEFFDHLTGLGIDFERSQALNGFVVDGMRKDAKVIVEFYGDTFHCNPKKFTDPDQYCSWIKRTVAEQWKRDQRRLACFYRLGYTVVIVWQSDWDRDKETAIERIQHALRVG